MQPNQSSSTNADGMESSRAHGLPVGSLGIFLPVCLLAIFLSCVVCAYSWQSASERRMDFEDNRKRKRTISKYVYGSSCTLKTHKSMPKGKGRAYPWKASSRVKDLPDVNNNIAFIIPTLSELKHGSRSCYGDSLWSSGCVGHPSGLPKKPILKRPNVHNSSTWTGKELLGLSFFSDTEINLSIPSSWSADTSGCQVGYKTENEDSGLPIEMDVINHEQSHVIEPLDEEIVCLQTLNGSLYEYWV